MRRPMIYFLIVLAGIITLTWLLTSSDSCKLKKAPSIYENTNTETPADDLTEEEPQDEYDDRAPTDSDVDAEDSEVVPIEGDEEELRGDEPEPDEVEDTSASTGGAYSEDVGDYLVIAGAYTVENNAKKELQRIRDLGYPKAEVVRFDYSDYYTICVARYESNRDATSIAKSLKSRYQVDAYVHKKRSKKN